MFLSVLRQPRAERSRAPLWLWPAVGSLAGFVAALVSVRVRLAASHPLGWLRWPGDGDSAGTLLQTVAGSVITVTGLTFTLTVVALQLASQQFSPRLLREFTRDRVIKAVLCVLVTTFVFTTTVLRYVRSDEPVPDLALLIASGLGLAALAAVLGFVTHIARALRVDTMMLAVHDETDRAIATFYPHSGDPRPRSPEGMHSGGAEDAVLRALNSGFVRLIDVDALVHAARTADVVIEIEVRPGDHVVRGTPVASVWTRDGQAPDVAALEAAVHGGIRLGYERTVEQDAAFGFRQLTDIAVKALSPALNDPVTAAHAIGHMADLLVKLAGRRLGATLHEDGEGTGRLVVPDRDLAYYLELACGQIRRYGRHEPTVLSALLRMLRDLAVAAHDDEQRAHIADQTDLVVAELPSALAKHDVDQVEDMAGRVRQALSGQTRRAYLDRSGETRSI